MEYRDKLILNIGSNFNHLSYADIEGIVDLVLHFNRSEEHSGEDHPCGVTIHKESGEIDYKAMDELARQQQAERENKQWPKHVRDKIEKAEYEHNTNKRVLRGKYS